jgi:hypothetical protein
MKLSTKILTGLLVLIVVALVFSNFIFKKEYDKMDKSDLYWNFAKVFEQPFKHVKIENSNITNVVFESNPKFSVRIFKNWYGFEAGLVKTHVLHDTLFILFPKTDDLEFHVQQWMKYMVLVRVFAPELLSVNSYNSNFNLFKLNQPNLDIHLSGKSETEVEAYSPVFNKLNISEDDSSSVYFEMSPDLRGSQTIHIDSVNATLKGLSWLGLGHAQVKSLNEDIEDSSAIELSGSTLRKIKNQNAANK